VDTIRVNGICVHESKFIPLGAHQSMEIQGPMKITLVKRHFDSIHIKKLNEAAQGNQSGQILAIVMEEGIAHVFLVTN
jgi:protein pelota